MQPALNGNINNGTYIIKGTLAISYLANNGITALMAHTCFCCGCYALIETGRTVIWTDLVRTFHKPEVDDRTPQATPAPCCLLLAALMMAKHS